MMNKFSIVLVAIKIAKNAPIIKRFLAHYVMHSQIKNKINFLFFFYKKKKKKKS